MNVTMKHPDVEGTAVVTERAFKKVWKRKGWTLVTESAPADTSDKTATTADSGKGGSTKQGGHKPDEHKEA